MKIAIIDGIRYSVRLYESDASYNYDVRWLDAAEPREGFVSFNKKRPFKRDAQGVLRYDLSADMNNIGLGHGIPRDGPEAYRVVVARVLPGKVPEGVAVCVHRWLQFRDEDESCDQCEA